VNPATGIRFEMDWVFQLQAAILPALVFALPVPAAVCLMAWLIRR
jgi:hypothetical protein